MQADFSCHPSIPFQQSRQNVELASLRERTVEPSQVDTHNDSILPSFPVELVTLVGAHVADELLQQTHGNIAKIPTEFQKAARAFAGRQITFDLKGHHLKTEDLAQIDRYFSRLRKILISDQTTLNGSKIGDADSLKRYFPQQGKKISIVSISPKKFDLTTLFGAMRLGTRYR